VAQADLLADVLELAGKEKALEGEALLAFAAALRDRAQLVLAERITPLEERIRSLDAQNRTLEKESAWRRQAMEGLEERVRGLEAENAWRREAMTGLEASVRGLEAENVWRREAMAGLEASVRALTLELATRTADHEKATGAHQDLLAHHQDVVRQVVTELLAVGALPWTRVRQGRQRLASLAELLRPEAP
jgi:chromosome segregation ATPase